MKERLPQWMGTDCRMSSGSGLPRLSGRDKILIGLAKVKALEAAMDRCQKQN